MKKMLLAVTLLAAALAGCKAAPAKTTKFMGDTKGMVKATQVEAYHKVWARKDINWDKYKKLYIAPVNTTYLRKTKGWETISLAGVKPQELAEFMRKTFVAAFKKNKGKGYVEVVDKADEQTLVLELAITEIVPTKAWLNTVGMATIGFVLDKGSVAMEGRLREGGTREVILVFADRECGKQNILNIKDFGWSMHAKAIIEEWAEQAVQVANTDEDQIVKDSSAFEVKLW